MAENNGTESKPSIQNGDHCKVVAGTHRGKSGVVQDIHASKSGAITITVMQSNGERFKTLAKNAQVENRES